jgi:NAD+ synthase (glutamine-hydrolysing)
MLRIALAQINPCVGDLRANTDKIVFYIKKAKKKGVDLIVFPELSLLGYPPEDLLLKSHFIDKNLSFLKVIQKECQGIVALIGFVGRRKSKLYNSCALIQDRKIIDVYDKIFLPNYGVFDEKRYFTSGDSLSFYILKGYTFSVSICEDIWDDRFLDLFKNKKNDFVINISASPFHLGKISLREKTLSYASKKLNSFVFYCNLVGGQDELVFDGTSKVFSPQGQLIKYAKRFSEDLLLFDLDVKKQYPPQKISIKQEEETYFALRLGLIDYVKKNGFKKVIVGVSGGIDSAVVVSLATYSLGKSKVCALIMPSCYTSKVTLRDAEMICRKLGIKYRIINIDKVFNAYIKTLKPFFKNSRPDKTEENIQARIRGNLLMAFSNKFNYLVLNTGNKSELSCGYCTLYGDMVGGFGLLKDVPKLLVYKLAHYINSLEGRETIPQSVIRRAPSAELRPHQKDIDTLPPYYILDRILKLYVEKDYSLDKIVKCKFKKKLVQEVITMVDRNEYKRRQAPIGIKITPHAFGKDRRMPITNKFLQ